MFKFFLLLALINFVSAQQFWSRCTHQPNIPTPHYIIAPGCTDRCRVQRGQTISPVTKIFFSDVHRELNIQATYFLLGIGIPIPVDPPFNNMCLFISIDGVPSTCPVFPDIEYTTTSEFLLPSTLPTLQNNLVRLEVLDGQRIAMCMELRVDIV